MILYSCRSIPAGSLLAKFDDDLNVAAIYTISLGSCDCRARKPCKHALIVEDFKRHRRVDTDWFLNHEDGTWHQPIKVDYVEPMAAPIPEKPFIRRV